MKDTMRMLEAALDRDKIVTDESLLGAQQHDYWVLSHLRDFLKRPGPLPLAIVRPKSAEDVQAVLRVARETRTPVIPFGLGSGVVGGIVADERSLILDMGAMNRLIEIDEENLLATFEAGFNGLAAEEAVNTKRLTIGHFPQSIAVSSVGGWVATRASGQFSTGWGNIEDIVYSLEVVLPDGAVVTLGRGPRASAGPDLRQLFLGSEGTLGIITKVTLSLRRKAEARAPSAWYCPSMTSGFEAQRAMVQAGWLPPVMRQYDEAELQRSFPDQAKDGAGLLLLVHEGPEGLVSAEKEAVTRIAVASGLAPAPEKAVLDWLGHRNQVPSWESFFEMNVVVDTVEVSALWSCINDVYERVVASLEEMPGVVNASAHSSHVYRSGLNLYFTFAVLKEKSADLERAYNEAWKRIIETTASAGGSISHHHGIGRVRRDYLGLGLGGSGLSLLRQVKDTLDPLGLMNPGVLLPGKELK